jgi:TonB family protein
MGKIVKYCKSCDEGFAERFGFCPDCGEPLVAYELNPMSETAAPVAAATPNLQEQAVEAETVVRSPGADIAAAPPQAEAADILEVPPAPQAYFQAESMNADEPRSRAETPYHWVDDGEFHVTVIHEKNVKQRNLLLLGSTVLIMTIAVGATIASLFNQTLGVAAIGDDRSIAMLIEEVPMVVEDKPEEKKQDKGGGGGGGGREDPDPVSQGDLADQSPTPTRPPDARVHRADNFELVTPPPQTEGDRKFPKNYDRWGDPNSRFAGLSNGTGTGGGQGSGVGTGQGSGYGTGTGSGSGSGSGSGIGDGDGDGTGPGGRGSLGAPPPKPVGVTSPVKILSKPQAKYNDAGRTNGVQGSVRLKVTLLASGEVGTITPVTRLPHGLTEQAIAAARQLKFEPKKVNGVPVSTIVTIDYSFSIY